MEGEFGKFEQAVGAIYLDDSSNEQIDYVCAELGRLSVAPGSFKTIEVAARPAG